MTPPTEGNSRLLLRRWQPWLVLAGVFILVLWAAAAGWPPPIIAEDLNQSRQNVALPAPAGDRTIQQSFTPMHDGLNQVEVLLVVYEQETAPSATFTMTLQDDAGQVVTSHDFHTVNLQHNQKLTIRFAPQPDSAGRTYTLILSGTPDNNVSAWGYELDTHAGGSLVGAEGVAELRFITRYRLIWPTVLNYLSGTVGEQAGLLLLALALIILPGALFLRAVEVLSYLYHSSWAFIWGWPRPLAVPFRLRVDLGVRWGISMALGLALWPLLWYWLTLLGGRWTGIALWIVLGGGWLLVALGGLWLHRQERHKPRATPTRRAWLPLFGLLLLLLISLAVRLLAVRDLAFPPWVDSSRHALITTVMAGSGQTIESYEPLLPVHEFPYHFGFHTLPAGLLLLAPFELPSVLLFLGQLLNALMPLSLYTAGWLLARRRGPALLAAFLVALPFFFPAYYATWGRFTQLTGVLVLPVLVALTWRLLQGTRAERHWWWLVGLLAAGLLLVHMRVFLVYVPFAALAWLAARGRNGRWMLAAGVLALLLVAPRLLEFAGYVQTTGALGSPADGYTDFPEGYVTTGWERYYLLAGGVALGVSLLALLFRRRWALLPLVLGAWVAVVLGVLSGRVPGIRAIWLINLNSAYITIFVPLALVLALVAGRLWSWPRLRHPLVQVLLAPAAGALLAALALFGARQQISILNAETILARPADAAALAWVEENLPADALIAVNSWHWLGPTWAGGDGGAWVLPLTGRASTTPPADYIFSKALIEEVQTFNVGVTAVTDWSDSAAAAWLRMQGVSHIFVGARGGFFDPAALARNPEVRLLYSHDGVFVFGLDGGPAGRDDS